VDSFTRESFKGNPAGVCILDKAAPENWMQNIAMEMNLSETAFVYPEDNGFQLRWFTPTTEVELCGHATLATAHILFETGILKSHETARFFTRSGLLTVIFKGKFLEMNFPATPAFPCDVPELLGDVLENIPVIAIAKNDFDLLVEVDSDKKIKTLQPDFTLMKNIDARGIIVTSRAANSNFDFVSRFFAPRVGINEDPVTGSAHCTLGPYWGKKLKRSKMTAYQASSRGGVIQVELAGDRVLLSGEAVTVLQLNLV